MQRIAFIFILTTLVFAHGRAQDCRSMGIRIGVMGRGTLNAITDVSGVRVGHTTLVKADSIRTGVTAILPHDSNIFQNKVPAAIYIGNGFGKLAGYTQVKELGTLETPVVLTNTLSVGTAISAVAKYTLQLPGNENVQSVNAVIGETNDGYLNSIRSMAVTERDVIAAIRTAGEGAVAQGNVGAGTGTVCFGWKGGIGTASRLLPKSAGGYTVGVLVQSNFGGVLQVAGAPVGKELSQYYLKNELQTPDGSCMIVVATDAPLDARNLERLAKRAFMGLAKTGGIASNSSGDYVIAFSTNAAVRVQHNAPSTVIATTLSNDAMSPLFMAAIEATEEAIINSLLAAKTTTGYKGHTIHALPQNRLRAILKKYNIIP